MLILKQLYVITLTSDFYVVYDFFLSCASSFHLTIPEWKQETATSIVVQIMVA